MPITWACPDLRNFFISALPEQSEIPSIEKQEKQETCQSIICTEERLDPRGVSNLPYGLTIKIKLSTFGVKGKVECVHY